VPHSDDIIFLSGLRASDDIPFQTNHSTLSLTAIASYSANHDDSIFRD
jgi:hypothetical protein